MDNKSGALKYTYSAEELASVLKKKKAMEHEFYSARHIFSYANWAMFFILLGGREAGKSYSITDFFCRQFKNKGIPFTWLRLTENASRKLLMNNAEKLVDPDLRRKYNLDLFTNGNNVYAVTKRSKADKHGKTKILEKKLFARVYALSTFYNDKGSIFDKDFLDDPAMRYNIAIDEFEREKGEKNTFDILYSLVNQLENLVRSTKDRIKIFFLGNTLEDASDILCAFNFIPETFGIFKLKSKRCVIENIEPTEAYLERRKGTIADILLPTASTFTNKIDTDNSLVNKKKRVHPSYVIRFGKDRKDQFTVWDSNIISEYKGEKVRSVSMRPYLDDVFNTEQRDNIMMLFDTRSFDFVNLIVFKKFQSELELLKPRK